MNALRLNDGFSRSLFCERTGLTMDVIHSGLQQAQIKELLGIDNQQIKPSPTGRLFLNDLLALF